VDTFALEIEAGFIDARRWLVHAVLSYRQPGPFAGLPAPWIEKELATGIVRESQRGRSLGARSVHVYVEVKAPPDGAPS
jgi:hypothetical protein